MSEWPEVRLGDLLKVKHGFAFKSAHFSDEPGSIVLTPGNFEPQGGLKLRPEKDRSYTGEYPAEFNLKPGDLLVVMTDLTQTAAILGAPAVIPEGIKTLHNQRLGKVVEVQKDRLDRHFAYYLFNSHEYREWLKSTATGSTVRHTSPSRIYEHKFRLPPIETQQRIAAILGAYDDLIGVNRRRVELLEEMARGLFEEWFVRFRFPCHEDVPIVDTPDGPLPEGWEVTTLGTVCPGKTGIQTGPFGSQLHQSDYTDDGVPVVMPKNIIELRIDPDGIARIPSSLADELGRHIMAQGDIVYGRRGDIGRRAFISEREHGFFCGTGCLRLRPDPREVEPLYLFLALGAVETESAIKARATGATMPNLSIGVMKDVPVLKPSNDLQAAFVSHIQPIQSLISNLIEANRYLAESRDHLLPRLISGQLSVEAVERELEDVA